MRAGLINNASCDRPCLFASYRRRWQRYECIIDHCPPAWAKHNRSYCERYPHRVCHSAGSALHHVVPNFRMPSARTTKKDHRTVGCIRISTSLQATEFRFPLRIISTNDLGTTPRRVTAMCMASVIIKSTFLYVVGKFVSNITHSQSMIHSNFCVFI